MMRPGIIWGCISAGLLLFSGCGENGGPGGTSGQGGSTAIFTIARGHLYVLDGITDNRRINNRSLDQDYVQVKTFELTNPLIPAEVDAVGLSLRFPETIHSDDDRLFVGGEDGMQILSLEEPAAPRPRGFFSHVRGCDPVVTDGELAFVTLRSIPGRCFSEINELQVVDISSSDNPQIISRYPLSSPWGLGVVHNHAYICDGSQGLSVLNVSDPLAIEAVEQFTDDICFDVIAGEELLISTGGTGIRQYTISENTPGPVLASVIPVGEQP